jgi:hypothetical protein
MAKEDLLPVDLLRQLLRYEAETGKLFWLHRPDARQEWNTRYAGKEAMTAVCRGYRTGHVNGVACRAHRVIWALVHGEWPDGLIDHINGETQDNRLHNLRVVDHTGNSRNRRLGKNSSSGVLGVFLFKPTGKWRAHIRHNGRQIALGDFANFEDAVQARVEAEKRLWQQTTP